MDAQRLDGHKKVLGILYIISAALTTLGALLINALLSLIFTFAFEQADPEEQRIMDLIMAFTAYLPAIIIFIFALPTFIAGIGLLTKQSWAVIISLIVGCLKLFSFPIGTAIGIYAEFLEQQSNLDNWSLFWYW